MPDFPWNNNFDNNTVNRTEPASDVNRSVEPETVPAAANDVAEPVAEENTKAAKTARRKPSRKASDFPHLDASAYEKIKEMLDMLSDSRTASVAKTLCETNKSDAATLLALLTETKNRKKIEKFAKFTNELDNAQPSDLKMRLAFAFMEDKSLSKTLFAVLNAAEPERGFGRATGDAMKDVTAIAEHWGDGVDLGIVEKLKI